MEYFYDASVREQLTLTRRSTDEKAFIVDRNPGL